MQTKDQVLLKIEEMMERVHREVIDESIRLLNCGALDLENASDNYIIPKIVMMVAMENTAHDYRPLYADKQTLKEIKNLRYF